MALKVVRYSIDALGSNDEILGYMLHRLNVLKNEGRIALIEWVNESAPHHARVRTRAHPEPTDDGRAFFETFENDHYDARFRAWVTPDERMRSGPLSARAAEEFDVWLGRLLDSPDDAYPHFGRWRNSSERLIRQLDILLDERQALLERLSMAYQDRDAAEARVRELERINEALQLERSHTGDPKLAVIAAFALVIATLLAPAIGEATGTLLDRNGKDQVEQVVNTATTVIVDCGQEVPVELVLPETE